MIRAAITLIGALLLVAPMPEPPVRTLLVVQDEIVPTRIYVDGSRVGVAERLQTCLRLRSTTRTGANRLVIRRIGHQDETVVARLTHYDGWRLRLDRQMPANLMAWERCK